MIVFWKYYFPRKFNTCIEDMISRVELSALKKKGLHRTYDFPFGIHKARTIHPSNHLSRTPPRNPRHGCGQTGGKECLNKKNKSLKWKHVNNQNWVDVLRPRAARGYVGNKIHAVYDSNPKQNHFSYVQITLGSNKRFYCFDCFFNCSSLIGSCSIFNENHRNSLATFRYYFLPPDARDGDGGEGGK